MASIHCASLIRCGCTKPLPSSQLRIEITSSGQNTSSALRQRNCASTINHYFDVNQLEIGAAFSSIARTINQLRLTQ